MTTSSNERQRIQNEKRKEKIAQMPKIPCACGCGTLIAPCGSNYVPHRYVRGHNHSHSGPTGRPAHNRIGDAPLTGSETTRRYIEKRYAEIDQMPKIPCACGCGTLIPPINKGLKAATYAHNHHRKGGQFKPGNPSPWKGKTVPHLVEANKNRPYKPETWVKRTATRRAKYGGAYTVKRGWKHSEESNAKNRERGKTLVGPKNPFYGKTHTPEERVRMSERVSGPKHPNWNGGAATLPYGSEFTRKYKHLIRQRDKYTCQRCGKTQEQEGRVLQVHHLDHDKMNNDPTNLVASCGSCNVWASYHRDEPFRP